MAEDIPAGWSWSRTDDAYGPVYAAWREVPEPVHLEARSVGELADQVASFHRPQGIVARFRRKGRRRLVYENGDVALSGSLRVRLNVVRRRSPRRPGRRSSSAGPRRPPAA
jgi:hypothetical protein